MTKTPLTDELHRLEHEENVANERRLEAKDAAREAGWKTHEEAIAPVKGYADAIAYKTKVFTEEEARQVTCEFIDKIRDENLILGFQNGTLRAEDPRPSDDFEAASREARAAKVARLEFEKEHADELAAERKRVDADLIREALSGDDGDRIRDALAVG